MLMVTTEKRKTTISTKHIASIGIYTVQQMTYHYMFYDFLGILTQKQHTAPEYRTDPGTGSSHTPTV